MQVMESFDTIAMAQANEDINFWISFEHMLLDLCVQCNNYFVQNSMENFTVHRGTKANMLCSKVCRYHFMEKNELLVSCAFCGDWDYDLYMLQSVDHQQKLATQKSSILHHFCSMSCYELFGESPSDCIGSDRKVVNEKNQKLNGSDKEKDKDANALKFKTVATQTDELTKCTCDTVHEHHMDAVTN